MSSGRFSPLQASIPEPPVASPCINVCTMNPSTGLCNGCLRTLEEIAAWGNSNNAYKRSVLAAIQVRREQLA
jgi:uncharacterized protein